MEQRADGFDVWQEPMVTAARAEAVHLRADPSSAATMRAWAMPRWRIDRVFLLVPAQVFVNRYIQSLVEFPPRQRPGSFNLEGVLNKLTRPPEGVN